MVRRVIRDVVGIGGLCLKIAGALGSVKLCRLRRTESRGGMNSIKTFATLHDAKIFYSMMIEG